METLTLLATVPAILALTNLAKDFGVTGKWSALLAVVLGAGLSVADGAFAAEPVYGWITSGLLLGLGAAGLFDLANAAGGNTASGTAVGRRAYVSQPAASDPESDA